MVYKSSLVAVFCALLLSAGQTTLASPLGKRSPHGDHSGEHHGRPDCGGKGEGKGEGKGGLGYGPPGGPRPSGVSDKRR